MTRYQIIMAVYRLLENSLTEESSEDFCGFLAGLDPFLWTDGKTADPDIFDEFSELADEKGFSDSINPADGLTLITEYIRQQNISDLTAAADSWTTKDWADIVGELTANTTQKKSCDCCGYFTLDAKDESEVCPVCFWEDDKAQRLDTTLAGGANKMSLDEARKNFDIWGACDEKVIPFTRMPTAEEVSGLICQPDDSDF